MSEDFEVDFGKTPLQELGFCYEDEVVFRNANRKGIIHNADKMASYLQVQINKSELFKDTLDLTEIEKREEFRRNTGKVIGKIESLSDSNKIIFEDEIEKLRLMYEKEVEEPKNIEKNIKLLRTEVMSLLLQKKRSDVSELIVNEFYKTNHIKVSRDDNNPEFKIYCNGIYVDEGKTYIEEFTRDVLQNNYSTQILNDVLNKISADNKCDFEKLRSERDPYLLATQDCLINLRTYETMDFSPDIVMFNKIPIKYDTKAECPKILHFLSEILETDEDSKLIQEIIGMGLVNDYFMEKAIMFLGSGRNGKGKLLQLMKSFYGVENTCSVRLQEMNTQSSSIWELDNKFVNLAGDLSNSSLKDTGLFKETTGRDVIQAKRKYKNDLKFTNSANHIFACNELPRVYDNSDGFWERWVLINFPYKFIEKAEFDKLPVDDKKNNKIMNKEIIRDILSNSELSGLLNLAIKGLENLKDNSSFTYSNNAEEVKSQWVRKADSFVAFCMDHVEEDYEGKVSKKEIKQLYNKYRKKFKLKNSSDISIKITLEEKYGVSEGQIYGSGDRFWEGIKLKNNHITGITGVTPKSSKLNLQGFPERYVMPVMTSKKGDIMAFLEENGDRLVKFEEIKGLFWDCDQELNELLEESKIFQPKKDNYRILE